MDDESLLTRQDVARILKVTTRSVDRFIREHGLPVIRIGPKKEKWGNGRGHTVRIRRADLERWLDSRSTSSG